MQTMARKKSIATINRKIEETEAKLSAVSKRYDRITEQLKQLQKEKQDYEANEIIEAYRQSGRSLDEVLIFLGE